MTGTRSGAESARPDGVGEAGAGGPGPTPPWLPGAWDGELAPWFTIVGLGRSGLAAANALAAAGAPVRVTDEYDNPQVRAAAARLAPDVPVFLGDMPEAVPGEVYVVSPGFVADSPRYFDLVASGRPVVDETEVFYHLMRSRFPDRPCRIIGITGTNGKTTTTALTAHLLREAGTPTVVGGNIGVPLCSQLDALTPQTVVVAELSEIHLLGQSGFHSDVAVITNIDYDHVIGLPVFGGIAANYHACKWTITKNLSTTDVLVYDADCVVTRKVMGAGGHPFGLAPVGHGRPASDGGWWVEGDEYRRDPGHGRPPLTVAGRSDVSTLAVGDEQLLLGDHNDLNVLMALAAGTAVGVPTERLRDGLATFRAPAHRVNLLPDMPPGKIVIDDSKATNTHAALAALDIVGRTYPGSRVVWLGGGQADRTPKEELVARLPELAVSAVLVGESAPQFASLLGPKMPVRVCAGMAEAVRAAFEELGSEAGILLLSPAAKSFDMFSDYADRARAFRAAVADEVAGVQGSGGVKVAVD